MTYQPVANYGIIGNIHTTALVGLNGSIDWFCFPNHDSPSVFAAILDDQKEGNLYNMNSSPILLTPKGEVFTKLSDLRAAIREVLGYMSPE